MKYIAIVLFAITFGFCQNVYELEYISPDDLINSLNVKNESSKGYYLNLDESSVYLHFNNSNNQIQIIGDSNSIKRTTELIQFYDTPPKQIIIEVKIIEVANEKLLDAGLDWNYLLERTGFNGTITYGHTIDNYNDDNRERMNKQLNIRSSYLTLRDLIRVLVEDYSAQIVNAPKIVTTNNRLGSILDGSHFTYVSNYSSYNNIYETQELSTGLLLNVTPSIGKGDYLSLDIEAKYTQLSDYLNDSPVETGQIIKNRVIAKNGEPFLLGSFTRDENVKSKRKIPILGSILPFLFSNTNNSSGTSNILIVLTPEVIDLHGSPIPENK
ncbi:MAG: hypothetical protein ISR95_03795 [Candidatus Marinimicrobia bacterium]|nr:hypothetical protein [candidate division KSB1 bacterium]MBL7046736.1 hypothetical protein [Candidatus Neomarinimicrobiota bacterium]